jgi:hypothetical protein
MKVTASGLLKIDGEGGPAAQTGCTLPINSVKRPTPMYFNLFRIAKALQFL